ncbi:unnamed protein product [Urochloa decumbens]|uniref:Uncharacterized protein n=1 Tax=Urochloa decumbens TaxID=240449 RepID=A0ABC9GEG6_9POAL
MAPDPSAAAKAVIDGKLRLLKKIASKMDLREAKDPKVGNLLHLAVARGHAEICRFLAEESGLDVNGPNPDGETPVIIAATGGKVSVLRYLLDHGVDPATRDATGATLLHIAAENGHEEAVRLLLSRGVDVDPISNRHITPLHMAAWKGHDQALKVLLEHGADPNRTAHHIFSPLRMACTSGSLKCIKLLVEAGADVNSKSPYGPNLLMSTASDYSDEATDIVKLLLEAGADPDIFTKDAGFMKEHTPADPKQEANEALAKGDYLAASYLYSLAIHKDPLDATLFSNRSLCWLRLGDGKSALADAQECKMIRPSWSKAWYQEGAALSMLKNYKGAANAFVEARKLDPACDENKTALRQCSFLLFFSSLVSKFPFNFII